MAELDEHQEKSQELAAKAPGEPETADDASSVVSSPAGSPPDEKTQPADTPNPAHAGTPERKHGLKRVAAAYWAHKFWTLPLTVLLILAAVMAVPVSRYAVLGLFIKEEASLTVYDATTNMPVSGAAVSFGSESATTSAAGKASLKLPVGNRVLTVTKQYYKTVSANELVSLNSAHNAFQVQLTATGRQVPVVVADKISGKPIANAELKVLDVSVKTDSSGKAIIVLPTSASVQDGTLNASGYLQTPVKVQVTGQAVPANSYSLTPAGYIYFLSNLSGKIDVVKTHLDGTGRQTVLSGTGHEHPENTVLLASRDWKYLALWAQRQPTGDPEIDLIDTSTDKMTNIDEGNAQFTLVGWDGDYFIYQVDRNNLQSWQSGQEALKSFNATTGKITVLTQTTASGSAYYDYMKQNLGDVYIVDGKVIYSVGWESGYSLWDQLNSKQANLYSVNPDGSNSTTVKSFSVPAGAQTSEVSLSVEPYDAPNNLAIEFFQTYYEYQNGSVSKSTDLNAQSFNNNSYASTAYLESPSGGKAFWSKPTDGKNALLVSDGSGGNQVSVAALSDYSPYGWYSDKYLLVSKNGSELYIMPAGGGTALKISDYFKPSQFVIRGYGGGYGGQ